MISAVYGEPCWEGPHSSMNAPACSKHCLAILNDFWTGDTLIFILYQKLSSWLWLLQENQERKINIMLRAWGHGRQEKYMRAKIPMEISFPKWFFFLLHFTLGIVCINPVRVLFVCFCLLCPGEDERILARPTQELPGERAWVGEMEPFLTLAVLVLTWDYVSKGWVGNGS